MGVRAFRCALYRHKQSFGEPDPFRLRHRAAIGKSFVKWCVNAWTENGARPSRFFDKGQRDLAEREQFERSCEGNFSAFIEGNFARYRIPLPNSETRGRLRPKLREGNSAVGIAIPFCCAGQDPERRTHLRCVLPAEPRLL